MIQKKFIFSKPSYKYNMRIVSTFAKTTVLDSPPCGFHQLRCVLLELLRRAVVHFGNHFHSLKENSFPPPHCKPASERPSLSTEVHKREVHVGVCFWPVPQDDAQPFFHLLTSTQKIFQSFNTKHQTAQSIVKNPTDRSRSWFRL